MSSEESRKVALGIGIFALILSLLFDEKGFVVVAILIIFGVLIDSSIMFALARVWHFVFTKLITLVSNALLVCIYIFFITPYAVIYRFWNKKRITHFFHGPEAPGSYYQVNKIFTAKDLENPW